MSLGSSPANGHNHKTRFPTASSFVRVRDCARPGQTLAMTSRGGSRRRAVAAVVRAATAVLGRLR